MPTSYSLRLCPAALVCSDSASSHAAVPSTQLPQKPSWSGAATSSCATCSWAAPWWLVENWRKLWLTGQWWIARGHTVYIKRSMSSEMSKTFSSRFPSVCSVRFKCHRAALNVVIYPLQHEDLPTVIRQIPLTLLDRITLFQSHVAQPPHLSPMWHQQKASVWLVLNSWGDQTVFCRK